MFVFKHDDDMYIFMSMHIIYMIYIYIVHQNIIINYMKNTAFMFVRTRDININQISPMIPYDDVFHEPGMTATLSQSIYFGQNHNSSTIIDCMDDIAYALCNTLTKSVSDYLQARNHDNLMATS